MPPPHFPPHHLPGAEDGSVPPEQIFPSANPVLDPHHTEDADHDQESYIQEDGNSSQSKDDSLSGLSEYRYYAFELSSEEGEASNSSDHGLSAYEPGHVLVGEPPSELDAEQRRGSDLYRTGALVKTTKKVTSKWATRA
jgi:hypothetical protein